MWWLDREVLRREVLGIAGEVGAGWRRAMEWAVGVVDGEGEGEREEGGGHR